MKHRLPYVLAAFIVVFGLLLAACGGAATATPADEFKVAMVFPGSISDKGFNQTGYDGLKMVEKELGAKIAYSENTQVADFVKVYRQYADEGYDVIVGHGFEFGEPAMTVAPDYPNIKFIVTNNNVVSAVNVQSVQPSSKDAAYLAGVLAGYMTKSKKLGGVAGFDFPVIVAQMEAYKLGAQSVDPSIEVTLVYIGSFADAAKAKEATLAQISAGADVIYHIADAAGLGVLQAVQEKNVMAIGWGLDQNSVAPKNVVTSQIVDSARMIYLAVKDVKDGKFKGEQKNYGFETGVVGLADFHGLVPEDIATKIKDTEQKILDGTIQVPFNPTKSNP